MSEPKRSLPLVAIVLAVSVLVINAPLIVGGKSWADLRYHAHVAPPRIAAAESVQSGVLPAWWEGSGLGVPLAAEPSHGAMYPLTWIATSTRALDWSLVLHFFFCALGIALWARRSASEPASAVVALLVVSGGLVASIAMRGVLPSISLLPWVGATASWLVDAKTSRDRSRATIGLALALGLLGLSGGLLFDGFVIALAIAARRAVLAYIAIAVIAGLSIAAAQWLPAVYFLGDGAGDVVHALPRARWLELLIPGSFGADGERAVAALAGSRPWAPSLFVGAGLLALACVRIPSRRTGIVIGVLALFAVGVGHGGWPAWVGAPEAHLAALVVVLGAHAAPGLDDLLAGKRRALLCLAAGAAFTTVALGALVVLRTREPSHAALDRALLDGGISLACLGIALVLVWREVAQPGVLVLLLLSTVSAVPSTAPTIDRPSEPAFAAAARKAGTAPLRVYRPVYMMNDPSDAQPLDDALATFAGASSAIYGVGAARSEDPARLPMHDRTWLAAAREGGALLDRFGIGIAILPETTVVPRKFEPLATRGTWALVKLPVAPPAGVLRGALWSTDPANTLDLMYPLGGGTGVLRGTVVLDARGGASLPDRGPPLPCTIERWEPAAIDVTCTTDVAGYATISSTPARGWSVSIDGRNAPWLTADLLRRATAIEPGTHRIAWRYVAPGSHQGLALAIGALLGLVAFALGARRYASGSVK